MIVHKVYPYIFDYVGFGRDCAKNRKAASLTLTEVGAMLGFSASAIGVSERGNRDTHMSMGLMLGLANVYDLHPAAYFVLDGVE
jgi:transcriptional regulator with XRE-family HTH domain